MAILSVFNPYLRDALRTNNAGAMLYVVGPQGKSMVKVRDFLLEVRETASNACRLVYEYNRYLTLTKISSTHPWQRSSTVWLPVEYSAMQA